jgi:hypothetical protein
MSDQSGPIAAAEVEPEPTGELTEDERLDALQKYGAGYRGDVPLHLLKHVAENARKGATAEVIESVREFGQHRPMVVQISTGEVIVGNHLFKALKSLGAHEGWVYLVDDDDSKALRRAIADNATGDKATWDEEVLAKQLEEVGALPGFEQKDVDKLLRSLQPEEDQAEPAYPLVPRLNERYDYVVIFSENETDWAWLETRFQLRREKSYKSEAVATSHVITVSRLQQLLDGE